MLDALMRHCSKILACALALAAIATAELADRIGPSQNHPAIQYAAPLHDPVAELIRRLDSGQASLKFEGASGYLRSLLAALNVPVESQIAVFSQTSLQADLIRRDNPRTIFFNDSVVVAWMRGGLIEMASQDPQRGVVFYILPQVAGGRPEFRRRDDCLRCHISEASLFVPGRVVRSTFSDQDGVLKLLYGGSFTDHRSPMEERWGGWYVTGSAGPNRHMGNAVVADPDHPMHMVTPATLHLDSMRDKFDTAGYLSPYSDIASLMVFDHQMYMMSLITRVGWEVRAAEYDARKTPHDLAPLLRDSAREFVDYLLFVDEAPLQGPIKGTSGFTEKFAAQGPRDPQGRSLRDLDLTRRLLRYPCSYMIYSPAFDALPASGKAAIYRRLWDVLSGGETAPKYARLTAADRGAILEILAATKKDLPPYFAAPR